MMSPELLFHPKASSYFNVTTEQIHILTCDLIEFHRNAIRENPSNVLKNAPESAVTKIQSMGLPPVCIKEIRYRGFGYSLKSLLRPSQGIRTFQNGAKLDALGIPVPLPLILFRQFQNGLVHTEWIVMEVVSGALELDRYLVSRIEQGWSFEDRNDIILQFGRYLGNLHSKGVFHADLKTCNILVNSTPKISNFESSPGQLKFYLVDYDEIDFRKELNDKKRIKNLLQIFLSVPSEIGASERFRFVNEYCLHAGVSKVEKRKIVAELTKAAAGKDILYVGFSGDIRESWPD
jgi:tRNA A-37 threonylcarbamoyl transferase component Bud32